MPLPPEPHREHPSTYFVQDRANADELHRLQVQDALVTTHMGGVLPEQPSLAAFQRVLDVGCGTGGWLIAVAKAYPAIEVLAGVDISRTFVAYARAQAEAEHVNDRVEFHCMDALRMLEFPSGYFDLVNHRFGMSWLRTWDWRKLLDEYQRVVQPQGTIRCVEAELATAQTPAFMTLRSLAQTAFYRAGHLFGPDGRLTPALPALFEQHGLVDIQTRQLCLEYHAGSEAGERFAEDLRLGLRTMEPFLHSWLRVPDNYGDLCQQASTEMGEPGFVVRVPMLIVWGRRGAK